MAGSTACSKARKEKIKEENRKKQSSKRWSKLYRLALRCHNAERRSVSEAECVVDMR